MPTYDYVCEACDHAFEEFQPITATPLRKCPACGKRRLKRLIGTGAGIIFKGSGFYETDYRSDNYKSAVKAEKEKATTKPEGDKAATKSEAATPKSDAASKSDNAGTSKKPAHKGSRDSRK